MNDLKPAIFLVPVVAFIQVIVFYVFLSKKVSSKTEFKRFTLLAIILAFILNFAWELIQGPLYKNCTYCYTSCPFLGCRLRCITADSGWKAPPCPVARERAAVPIASRCRLVAATFKKAPADRKTIFKRF